MIAYNSKVMDASIFLKKKNRFATGQRIHSPKGVRDFKYYIICYRILVVREKNFVIFDFHRIDIGNYPKNYLIENTKLINKNELIKFCTIM